MKKLKADLHNHTAEDPVDVVKHSVYELIDRAHELNYDVLAVTNHDEVFYPREVVRYAEQRNILLIPGMEATLSGKHVLILNPSFRTNPKNRPLEDLARIKTKDNLIVAPHPFFPQPKALKTDFFQYRRYFDAIEFSHYYHKFVNFNKKAVQISERYNLPLLATSDCHFIKDFGVTYSLIEAEKNLESILEAVKQGKIEICSSPLPSFRMGIVAFKTLLIRLRYGKRFKSA